MNTFDDRPFIAIWELTRACDLVCLHCRAEACKDRDPAELTTDEGKQLLDRLAAGGVPLVVLTGGDPAKRDDLVQLVSYGTSRGLSMALTPSATPLVTDELIHELAEAGLTRLAISIDGPDAAVHDAFRGIPGSFDAALRILATARKLGLSTQINTSLHTANIQLLPEFRSLVRTLAPTLWSVFVVVRTGRATNSMVLSAEQVERLLENLAEASATESFAIKTTAAPHLRRVLLQQKKRDQPARGRMAGWVNEGRGFMFVSHLGEVFPSGFLPVPCGNVRDRDPLDIYRDHPVFRALRDEDAFSGKCGVCEYRKVCGGSRARALSQGGDMFGSDPACAYIPPRYQGEPLKRTHLKLLDQSLAGSDHDRHG
jgi:radical SAM protein with 4Fe4S-binding SPASM domain